jgi:hypothetical protein
VEQLARVGLVAQGVSFALVAVLAIKLEWLLGFVAAGLFAFALFCLIQARYREI